MFRKHFPTSVLCDSFWGDALLTCQPGWGILQCGCQVVHVTSSPFSWTTALRKMTQIWWSGNLTLRLTKISSIYISFGCFVVCLFVCWLVGWFACSLPSLNELQKVVVIIQNRRCKVDWHPVVASAKIFHSKEIREFQGWKKLIGFKNKKLAGEMVVEVFVYTKWNGGWGSWCITKRRILRCDFHFHQSEGHLKPLKPMAMASQLLYLGICNRKAPHSTTAPPSTPLKS